MTPKYASNLVEKKQTDYDTKTYISYRTVPSKL